MHYSSRFILLLACASTFTWAKELPVADSEAFHVAVQAAQPGDVIVMREGEWKDAKLKFSAKGTVQQPIVVRAAVAGKTIFTGASSLGFGGEYLSVEGLAFHNPSEANSEVLEFRENSKKLASHCCVRDCTVTDDRPAASGAKEAKWCSIYGEQNIVERCHFEGKTTRGTTLVVWLAEGLHAQHILRDCYFGPRGKLGKNGGETIRLGDSNTAHLNAHIEVSGNLFYQCNGEGEIISVKSNENKLTGNTFLECEGALTLRHSHRSEVSRNFFIGNHKPLTGGVRIIGEDHQITHNHLQDLGGDEYRSGFCFMNALPDSPANGYYPVKRVRLAHNTLIGCKQSICIGMAHDEKCTLVPLDCVMVDNLIVSPERTLINIMAQVTGWSWSGNVMLGKALGMEAIAASSADPELKKDADGVWRKSSASPTAGADLSKAKPLTRATTGPRWSRG